ncbi:MAG: hypothetical protein ACOX8X_05710 [Methanomethylophilus sp.]|jgi:electron transfer flavoprotein alpha subunit
MPSCESCSSGSCATCSNGRNRDLPPGMLEAYKLNTSRSDGYLVWIEIEHTEKGPKVSKASKEILSRIREVNDGSRVWGVAFGHIELKPLYPEIFSYGVETLYEVHDRRLVSFQPEAYADCLAQIIIRTEAAMVLLPASPRGRELAPRTAARLEAGLEANIKAFGADGRDLVIVKEEDGKRLRVTYSQYPQMATVVPGSLSLGKPEEGRTGTVIYWQYAGEDFKQIVEEDE